jgi:hypothetical protein
MIGRTTLALVGVALALGAWVWFVEIRGEEGRLEAERAEGRLLAVEPDAVTALRVPLRSGSSAYLVREDGGWALREPIQFAADAGTVTTLLNALQQVESKSEFGDLPDDLAPFGLGDSAPRVEIWSGGEEPLVLRLGGETPLPGSVYAQLESQPDRLHTIDTYRSEALRPELQSLRESRISQIDGDAVGALRVREGKRLVAAAKRVETLAEEGGDSRPEWRVLEPVEGRGDAVRIRRLVQDLSLARATAFIDAPGPLSTYGLASPEVAIELVAGDETERIILGRAGDEVYARRNGSGPIYQIHERTLQQVPRETFAFRDKEVFTLEPLDVRQIELHFAAEGESRSLVRDESGWRVVDHDEPVPTERVEDLVFALEYVEATSIEEPDVERTALGLSPPVLRIVALDGKGAELGWLELGAPTPGEGMPAVSSQNEYTWRVLNDLADTIPVGFQAYQNRWLSDFDSESDAPQEEPGGGDPLSGEDLE